MAEAEVETACGAGAGGWTGDSRVGGWAEAGPLVLQAWDDVVRLVATAAGRGDGAPLTRPAAAPPADLGPAPLHVLRGRCRVARDGGVHDDESGCVLPGLPSLLLTPQPWWQGSVADWAARQLTHHVSAQGEGVGVPVVTGRAVGHGWDGEPLLGSVSVVAVLAPAAVSQALLHHRSLAAGRWPSSAAAGFHLVAT